MPGIPNLVSRNEWGAKPPRKALEPLENLPIRSVRIYRRADTERCDTKADCMRVARKLQEKHVKEDSHDDVQFNFMIGEDGNVYEGRGWSAKPGNEPYPVVNEKYSIDIMIIGNDNLKLQNHPIYEQAWEVINCGVEQKIIEEDYNVIWDIQ